MTQAPGHVMSCDWTAWVYEALYERSKREPEEHIQVDRVGDAIVIYDGGVEANVVRLDS